MIYVAQYEQRDSNKGKGDNRPGDTRKISCLFVPKLSAAEQCHKDVSGRHLLQKKRPSRCPEKDNAQLIVEWTEPSPARFTVFSKRRCTRSTSIERAQIRLFVTKKGDISCLLSNSEKTLMLNFRNCRLTNAVLRGSHQHPAGICSNHKQTNFQWLLHESPCWCPVVYTKDQLTNS